MGSEATRFKKGDVNNPRGRPPMPKDVKEAIQRAGRVAVQRMEELLEAERFEGLDQKVQVRLIEVACSAPTARPPRRCRGRGGERQRRPPRARGPG